MSDVKLWLPPNLDPLENYRTEHSADFNEADFAGGGYTSVRVLPELINCKLDMIVVSLLRSLGARSIRISGGCVTTDSSPGRATVIVDSDDIIQSITMEVGFFAPKADAPMCGADLNAKIKKLRVSKKKAKS